MSDRRARMLILSFSDISADARVLKQVRHFSSSYDVTTCGFGPTPDERATHIPLESSTVKHPRRDLVLRNYRKLYRTDTRVVSAKRVLAGHHFDVIIANDIETVGLALSLAPVAGVHADLHEYSPRLNEEIPSWRYFIAPYMRWLCRTYLTKVDSMTTVGAGIAAEYKRCFGVDAEIVTNAAPATSLAPKEVSNPVRLVHSGAALRNRCLDRTVRAVVESNAAVTLDLYLVPNDPSYLDTLRKIAGADSRVRFHDPVPYSRLLEVLNECDIGIHVIPPTNFNNRWALPNKFFDYVQARLAVLVGPSPEMADVVRGREIGAVAPGFSVGDIRECLERLTPSLVAEWKSHSNAAAAELSAERQVEVWNRSIVRLLKRGVGAP